MQVQNVTPEDIKRIESKLDKLGDAVGKLVLVEERQTNQTLRLEKHDAQLEAMQASIARAHARVDKFINLGTGGMVVCCGLFELARFIFKS